MFQALLSLRSYRGVAAASRAEKNKPGGGRVCLGVLDPREQAAVVERPAEAAMTWPRLERLIPAKKSPPFGGLFFKALNDQPCGC